MSGRVSDERLASIIAQRESDVGAGRCMFVVLARGEGREDSILVEDVLLDLRDARAALAAMTAERDALRAALVDARGEVWSVCLHCAGEAGITCCCASGKPMGAKCLSAIVWERCDAALNAMPKEMRP